jgi:hypothetical protein
MRKLALLALLIPACAEPGPPGHKIEGRVTLDGQPLAEGYILFLPEGSAIAGAGAPIQNGRYAARVSSGPKRVRITAERVMPGKLDPLGMPVHEQYVPERYNKDSTLTMTVEGNKTQDFPLTSP